MVLVENLSLNQPNDRIVDCLCVPSCIFHSCHRCIKLDLIKNCDQPREPFAQNVIVHTLQRPANIPHVERSTQHFFEPLATTDDIVCGVIARSKS